MSLKPIRAFKTKEEIVTELRRLNSMPRNYALQHWWRDRCKKLEKKLERITFKEKRG